MEFLSLHAPMNCKHKKELIEAEMALVSGNFAKAERLYLESIKGANESRFMQEEAISNERLGEFYLLRGQKFLGQEKLATARELYLKRGAISKVEEMERRFAFLRPNKQDYTYNSNQSVVELFLKYQMPMLVAMLNTCDTVYDNSNHEITIICHSQAIFTGISSFDFVKQPQAIKVSVKLEDQQPFTQPH